MTRAEQVTGPVAYHGEGPVWSHGLQWVDMLAGDVLRLDETGVVDRRHIADVVAALRPRASGGWVYAVERGFALDTASQSEVVHLPQLWSTPATRMNEGACAPDGSFYCGSMAYDLTPGAASLYRLDPDGTTTTVLTGLTISNGVDWSPDGTLAYYVDTATGRIDVFDFDSATGLSNRRPFTTPTGGSPDGLTVDADGGVWVGLWGGSAVHRYAPDGTLSAVVDVNARQVTACTFGGAQLNELYITTSRQGLGRDEDAAAGSLFRVEPGVAGRPVRPFAG